jgi:MIP family channel proteins
LQIALIWGLGVTLAIFSTAAVSGAHLNPAVSLTLAVLRRDKFPTQELPAYVMSQFLGGFLGSVIVFASLGGPLLRQDELRGIKPGDAASVGTAAAFGEYFPNPGTDLPADYMGPFGAFAVEALGTGILMFMIFAVTDERNPARPSPGMAPFFIGMTVTVLISLFAPLTQAGWNPARDFAPRIVAVLAGYGRVAIPGPRGGFWAYLLGPCFGAPIGGLLYDCLIAPGLPMVSEERSSMGAETRPGMWCADQAVFQNLVREACSTVCDKVDCEPTGSPDPVVSNTDKGDSMC